MVNPKFLSLSRGNGEEREEEDNRGGKSRASLRCVSAHTLAAAAALFAGIDWKDDSLRLESD